MPILRRILKYVPAVLALNLGLVWCLSWFAVFGVSAKSSADPRIVYFFGAAEGVFHVSSHNYGDFLTKTGRYWIPGRRPRDRGVIQRGGVVIIPGPYHPYPDGGEHFGVHLQVPILLLVTLFLPMAIGLFISFRFRHWHYLAYTALVAIELAYYLQWQG